jgi:hypothetical protein
MFAPQNCTDRARCTKSLSAPTIMSPVTARYMCAGFMRKINGYGCACGDVVRSVWLAPSLVAEKSNFGDDGQGVWRRWS